MSWRVFERMYYNSISIFSRNDISIRVHALTIWNNWNFCCREQIQNLFFYVDVVTISLEFYLTRVLMTFSFFLQHFQSGVDTFTKQNQSIYFDNPHRNCAICQIWMDRQYDEILQLHTMMSQFLKELRSYWRTISFLSRSICMNKYHIYIYIYIYIWQFQFQEFLS